MAHILIRRFRHVLMGVDVQGFNGNRQDVHILRISEDPWFGSVACELVRFETLKSETSTTASPLNICESSANTWILGPTSADHPQSSTATSMMMACTTA